MKETQRKDLLNAVEILIDEIKEADTATIKMEAGMASEINLNTGFEESDFTGEQTFTCNLYIAKRDKRASLYARCQSEI